MIVIVLLEVITSSGLLLCHVTWVAVLPDPGRGGVSEPVVSRIQVLSSGTGQEGTLTNGYITGFVATPLNLSLPIFSLSPFFTSLFHSFLSFLLRSPPPLLSSPLHLSPPLPSSPSLPLSSSPPFLLPHCRTSWASLTPISSSPDRTQTAPSQQCTGQT